MTKRLQVYETPEIVVTFDPNVCIHSAVCVTTLPAVFDVRRARWVRPEAADASEVAATVQKCPSGALRFYRNVGRNPNAARQLARAILVNHLAVTVAGGGDRAGLARALCEAIRAAGPYRWVGLYEVTGREIVALGWTGETAPGHVRFPADRGLCGAVARARAAVVVDDVGQDARYLTTFGDTRAEMVVPVIDRATRAVVATIDIESDRAGAFSEDDRMMIEDCASAIAPLWAEKT